MTNKTTIHTAVLLKQLSRSTAMAAALQAEAEAVAKRATQIAQTEVGQRTGQYAASFGATTTTAEQIANAYKKYERKRQRRGSFSPLIEGRFEEGAYTGVVGVAYSNSWRSIFVEVGSYGKPGKYVLTRAATEGRSVLGSVAKGNRKGPWKSSATTRSQRRQNLATKQSFEAQASSLGIKVPKNYSSRAIRRTGELGSKNLATLAKKQGVKMP